jgi:hypothetical protein
MGVRIEAPKQDGNARFNTLKVNLNENNLATRVVVVDEQGNFYYGSGGGGGTAGTNGSSGTSGANGTSGVNGSSGSSGTSGTGFNTIADALQGRVLLSDGSTNNASASANLFYDTGSSTFQITGSIVSTQGFTGSLEGTASWAINASSSSYAPNIYNSDGTLTGNRTITSSFYSLTVNSTKSTGSTFIVSHLQTQSNATDTADIGMQVTYNISASSATNQLVARAFQLSVFNNLLGGGSLQNLRCFNLAAFFGTGTTTDEADLIYLERGNLTGTIGTYRAIRIANYTGTNRGGIAMAAIGGSGNAAYVNMGSIVIPTGRWGIYQSETSISNYFAQRVLIGTTTTGSYSLDVSGSSRTNTLHVQNLKNPAGSGGQIDIFVVNNPGDAGYQKLSILAGGSPYSTVLQTSGDGGGSRGMILDASGPGGEMYFNTSNVSRWILSGTYNSLGAGHLIPVADALYNVGDITRRISNYYGVRSYISSLLSVTGSAIISGSVSIIGPTTSSGDIIPGTTDTFNLGSSSNRWKDLYLSGSTIYLGNIQLKEQAGNFVAVSGSTNIGFSGSFTGSLFGTSSWAVSASWAPTQTTVATASLVSSSNVFGPYGFDSIKTSSFALTASSADDFLVRGTLTAQTIVAQVITSSTEYITGSTIFGSELSNTHQFTGSASVTGSFQVNDSLVVLSNQTGSMFVATSSYAFTASDVDSSNINNLFRIATGSISASVNVTPESLFLINSGFTQYFNISSSGDTDIYSNLFIVRNFNTQQPVLTVSQSIVQIATQSFDPTGTTQAGSIWFTSASMFVGLE